jgi:hypothetical protein
VDPFGLFSISNILTAITAWHYENRDAKNIITETKDQIKDAGNEIN